jgi:chloramphenicol 3-O phosphotransferase
VRHDPGGTVIFLNGASSSGKGTLARALQNALDEMFLHARGTAFIHDGRRFVRIDYGEEGRRAFRGFFGMVGGVAEEGNNVVVDAFLSESWMIPTATARLGGLQAYLVGVRCTAEELERRESERGDRFPGIALALAEAVHRYVPFYDVEVDTASSSVEESVRTIVARLACGGPQAFKALGAI